LQRNYNKDVMGINYEHHDDEKKQEEQAMNVEVEHKNANEVNVEVEVQTIVADQSGNIMVNNNQQNNAQNTENNNDEEKNNVNAESVRPRRREYLHNLLDLWDRFNEIVNGEDVANDVGMDTDNKTDDEYKGIMGFVESVFDELVDYQNSIESGLNVEENKKEKDDDDDMEMKEDQNQNECGAPRAYKKEEKDELAKKVESAGNMLVEIGTVLASLGHMINKMDIKKKMTTMIWK